MAAVVGLVLADTLLAHGGVGGAVVEASAALLIVAVALAVWVANRREKDE